MPSRPTFAQALNSGLPEAIQLCAADRMRVAAAVNEAQERLISDPLAPDEGWYGGWATMLFNVNVVNHSATIVTPREVARLIVMDICKRPRFIRNGFYEYLMFGTGAQPRGCNSLCCQTQQAFDRPNVVTLAPFPTSAPQFITLYPSDVADVGKRMIIQGLDQNGKQVLGTDPVTGLATIGEAISLALPFSTTVNQYQQVQGFIKDQTKGPVTIFAVDPSTHSQTQISAMEVNETTASYREYFLNGLPDHCCNGPNGIVQVQAQARLDFIPVVNDTDYLLIQSLPALIEEVQSNRYSRMDAASAPSLEAKHHSRAIALLNGQLDLYQGKERTAISVPIFGSNKLRPQPV